MPVLEPINSVSYRIRLGRDNIELGDSAATAVVGYVKYNRNRGTWFKLSHPGIRTGLAAVDIPNGIVRIPYGNETVELTAHDPDAEYPDGRAEFNVILNSKPTPDVNGEYWQILDFSAEGLVFERVLGLDEEYSQERCYEDWYADLYDNHPGNNLYGHDNGTGIFIRTSIEIRTPDGQIVLRTRTEHLVHSLEGKAVQVNRDTSVMGKNPANGQDITYTRVSRDHLSFPRRLLVDAKGKTARIEDVQFTGTQLKFKLPKAFIEAGSTKYPIQHATGVDPAYTQTWGSFQSTALSGDGQWTDVDLTALAGDNVVAEIILSNATSGTENTLGVRANGSSLARYVILHEAEGGGQTHCRMFVQTDAGGVIEAYHSDISDADYFYVAGYWSNVTFTEQLLIAGTFTSGSWVDEDAGLVASKVYHCVMLNGNLSSYQDAARTVGLRANGSTLERKIVSHESEAGGSNLLDLLVKTDSSGIVEVYSSENNLQQTDFLFLGYFDSALDFVEKWQDIGIAITWPSPGQDLTGYLDINGRMCDFLLVSYYADGILDLGVRDGDDSSTARLLIEHEAEGADVEYTGFSMSAKTDSDGHVKAASSAPSASIAYLTGYFKPAAGGNNYTYTGTPKIGVKDIADRATTGIRTGLIMSGATAIQFKNTTSNRISLVTAGLASIVFRYVACQVTSLLTQGITTIATKVSGSEHQSLTTLGLWSIADRLVTLSRVGLNAIGVTAIPNRVVGASKTSLLLIGIITIPTRHTGLARQSLILLGENVAASRVINLVKTGLSTVGATIISDRNVAALRAVAKYIIRKL